jgi:regulator of sigma E protease
MYYTIEIIRGRPLSESWIVVGQKVGFVMLGALMMLALYNDIDRLLTGSF